jgi:hypothetical protein
MKHSPTLSISKLDAARRQLEVAIRLYFFDDDPVSIYTLGAAAYGVLRDIALAKKVQLLTGEQRLIDRVVPGKERELLAALRRHQNFFKHADRDPDAAIDFNPESTEWLLFDSTVAYAQLTNETTPLMGTFNLWWQYSNRDLIKEEHSQARANLEVHSDWFTKGRRVYFARVLPIFNRPNAG